MRDRRPRFYWLAWATCALCLSAVPEPKVTVLQDHQSPLMALPLRRAVLTLLPRHDTSFHCSQPHLPCLYCTAFLCVYDAINMSSHYRSTMHNGSAVLRSSLFAYRHGHGPLQSQLNIFRTTTRYPLLNVHFGVDVCVFS